MASINKAVRERFSCARDNGLTIHEIHLRVWALEANDAQGEHKIADFVASHHWLVNFKAWNKIVSRKITKVVSRANYQSAGEKLAAVSDFRREIRSLADMMYEEADIYNTDQSGFQKEMHAHRTLEVRGTQQVSTVVQSVSSTTHSYTIQPTFSLSGHLIKPLLVILQEPGGKMSERVRSLMYDSDELFVVCSASGKINKHIMEQWFNEVYLRNVDHNTLLLVDSLTTYKDIIDRSNEGRAQQCHINVIPPGTTGMVQPADVYFFRQYKSFYRHISDHVLLDNIEFQLFQRDSILKLQAFVHSQFRSPRFRGFLQYAWYKAGLSDKNVPHDSPMDFCFPKELVRCDDCTRIRLLRCAWCKKSLCFDHSLRIDHPQEKIHMCQTFVA